MTYEGFGTREEGKQERVESWNQKRRMNASKGKMHLLFMKNAHRLWTIKIINLFSHCNNKRFLDILMKMVSV